METGPRGLTIERLRNWLDYDPQTGIFRWKAHADRPAKWNGRFAGKVAGTVIGRYRYISILDRNYAEHRLAWAYVHDRWPAALIDHRDMDGCNNAIDNLREATHSTNKANRHAPANNATGFKGVSFNKASGRYQASICRQYQQRHLGLFDTAAEAHAAYCRAAEVLFGEFARVD